MIYLLADSNLPDETKAELLDRKDIDDGSEGE